MERVVLVTGSTSGIGAACARAFAASGDRVVLNSRASVEAGKLLAAELGGDYVQGDVSTADGASEVVAKAVAAVGRLDVLVNNAGRTIKIPHADLDAVTPEIFADLYQANVIGPFLVARAALPALRDVRGCVVNVSSVSGLRPLGSSIPYAVSKAALNHLTRLLAAVLGPEVRVNAVAPGLVDTPWTKDWDAERTLVGQLAPLQRSGQPDDIARVVLALADASYATGEVWVVDGGISLR